MNKRFSGSLAPLLCLGLSSLLGCHSATQSPQAEPTGPAEQVTRGTVTVEVVVDGNVDVFEVVDVAAGTSLESLMREMTEPLVELRGSGTTAFIDTIGGKATSASEGWTFLVDGAFANEGVGNTMLHPPTTIRWRYGDFREPAER